MSARFEVVRTNGDQPWHARLVVNGRITWHTEQFARMVGAERAILSLLRAVQAATAAGGMTWNVEGREKVVTNWRGNPLGGLPLIEYLDERPEPPPEPVIDWPVYHRQITPLRRDAALEDYWHDRDLHWRNCFDDECDEAVPPVGAEVRVRFGVVKVTRKLLAARFVCRVHRRGGVMSDHNSTTERLREAARQAREQAKVARAVVAPLTHLYGDDCGQIVNAKQDDAVADWLDATADHLDATGGHCVCDDAALAVAVAYIDEPTSSTTGGAS